MLNLTQMFSMRPLPVTGGRFVKGYAMSGSKCNTVLSEEAIQANGLHKRKKINDDKVIAAMLPERAYTLAQLERASGVSKTSLSASVDRLLNEGLIKYISGVKCRFFMLAD